ncbi:MAG: helix-turn-helix domain-containing protein, partial [Nocardioidaceae bacterium]|nr:helix-turn-helix domain-containing protein [Nocardioidaceae bacterium]
NMVVAPHRDGGQAQFIESPVPVCSADTLQPLLEWMGQHLADELTVETLAAQATMSPRTFARRFKAETGTTPYHWITNQRVLLAERLLEGSDETVERIATQVGLSNATAFRHHFARLRGTSPQRYRRLFRQPKVPVRSSCQGPAVENPSPVTG